MSERKVYHLVDLDDADHWCENGCRSPKGMKTYIDAPSGFNPAFWCEDCVKNKVSFNFKVQDWVTRKEYLKLEANV